MVVANGRSGLQGRCPTGGQSCPGCVNGRVCNDGGDPTAEIILSAASPTHVKPVALSCRHVQRKLGHGGIQPSRQCCVSASASLRVCAVPPQISRADQALGSELPPDPSSPPPGLPLPSGDSLGTAAWQLSPATGGNAYRCFESKVAQTWQTSSARSRFQVRLSE